MKLRPYQAAAIQAILSVWAMGERRTLISLPTGTGKTIVFSQIAKEIAEEGYRVLILAHRGELLKQAMNKLKLVTGIEGALEQGQCTSIGSDAKIVIASVQSMMQDKRLAQFSTDYFNYIIIDEAHHSLAPSYQKILAHFQDAYVLGVTATPERGDERNLLEYYDCIAYEYTLEQAIKDDYLCPIKAQMIPLKLDISQVKIANGDFAVGQLGESLDAFLYQIAEEMKIYCKDRKTVVFLPLIKTSQKFCKILRKAGFKAAEINGQSENREKILRDFDKGKYQVLSNSMLLTEGWDGPSVDCIIVLRPTRSHTLYRQMVGRGTRLHPGKEELLLLDFLWITSQHDLCHPSCLTSIDAAEQEQINEMIKNNKEGNDIFAAKQKVLHGMQRNLEEQLLKELRKTRNYKSSLVQLIDYACGIESEELIYLHSEKEEKSTFLTEEQCVILTSCVIDATSVQNEEIAEKAIQILHERAKEGLATPKQIRRLEYYGFRKIGTWSKKKAFQIIKRIAANGWNLPDELAGMIEKEETK